MDSENHKISISVLIITFMNLNLMCWNVRGIMSSAYVLSIILDESNIDVSVVVEHKLLPHSLRFMQCFNQNYNVISVADTSLNQYGPPKCGKGGVSIFFRKSLSPRITKADCVESERILAIKLDPMVCSAALYYRRVYAS